MSCNVTITSGAYAEDAAELDPGSTVGREPHSRLEPVARAHQLKARHRMNVLNCSEAVLSLTVAVQLDRRQS